MKKRFTALALAGAILAGLCACSTQAPVPSEPPTPEVSSSPTAAPETAGTAVDPAVSPIPDKGTPPEETAAPSEEPSQTPDQTASPAPSSTPSPTPAPAPSEAPSEAPAKKVSAADVYAAVAKAAGVSYDDSTSYVEAFYTSLDTGSLSDYVLYMPSMSSQLEEIFIAKVSGGVDAVKSACLDRQKAMAEEAAFYGDTGSYVEGYQLVTEGDWVLFCVCEKAADAVSAFRNAVK